MGGRGRGGEGVGGRVVGQNLRFLKFIIEIFFFQIKIIPREPETLLTFKEQN